MSRKNIPSGFVFLLVLVVISRMVIAEESFWKIQNVGASQNRLREVSATLEKCQSGLKPYFDQRPSTLIVYLYGTRSAFVKGLRNIHSFSEQGADYFKESSAPRPLEGNFLVPPDQDLKNVCHEIIHHYLESHTNKEHLLNAKWFDEGTASLLANMIFNPEKLSGMRRYVLKTNKDNFIPIEKMQSEKDWDNLHKRKEWRSISYLQAMFMMNFFFQKYSTRNFKRLLMEMHSQPFDKAFKKVCKNSQKRFYEKWKKDFMDD